jgi:hypothetical protein
MKEVIDEIFSSMNESKKDALMEIFEEMFCDIKITNPEKYHHLEYEVMTIANKGHFDDKIYRKAVSCLLKKYDVTNLHWSLEQTDAVAKNLGYRWDEYNNYEFNFVMNMLHCQFHEIASIEATTYAKMANKWLEEHENKVLKYFMFIMK